MAPQGYRMKKKRDKGNHTETLVAALHQEYMKQWTMFVLKGQYQCIKQN